MADPKVIVGVPVYPSAGVRSLGTGEKLNEANIGRLATDLANGLAYVKQTAEGAADTVKSKLFAAKAAATANVASLSGTTTLDGISCGIGDRVFLFQQSVQSQNGPWIIGTPWTRPSDFDASSKVVYGQEINVVSGLNYAGKTYELVTAGPYILDTTPLVWSEKGGSGGTSAGTIQPVDAVATSNVTLSAPGFTTLDGVSLTSGSSRILLTAQSTASQNGVYLFNGSGSALTRTADADADGDLRLGQQIKVKSGTLGAGTIWELSSGTTIAGSKTYSKLTNAADKSHHDTMFARGIFVNPTGVYATDEAALNAAAATQRATHLPIKLGQGQFNVRANVVDFTGLLGAVVEGVGKSAPNSAVTRTDGTTIKCVGKVAGVSQRAASSWLINMNGSQYCRFKGITFVSGDYTDPDGACETLFRQQIGDGGSDGPFVQPESNTYEDCGFEGVLNYVSTSTTSRKLVPGTIVWSGVTGTWPVGSRVTVYSASGDAIGYGTVSSFSGGNLAVAITKARNNGAIAAHTDWRFYQSSVGVTMPLASNTSFVSCHIAGLEHFADVSGSVNSRMQNCIISQNSMLGHTLIGSQTVVGGKFDFVVEPGLGGWGCGADISTCLRTELNITSGDSYSKGELLEITGCRDTRVNGVINSTAAGSWLIRANGTENLKVEGYADATGGYGIAYLGLPSYLRGNPTLTISGNTITRSAGTWDVGDAFAIGDSVTLYNSTSNNVTRNVTNISGGGAILTVDGAALTNETAANICVLTQAKTNINLKPTIDWPMFTGTGLYLGVSGTNHSQHSWRGSDGIWHNVEQESTKLFSAFGVAIPFIDLNCDTGVGLSLNSAVAHITTSGGNANIHGIAVPSDPGAYAHLQALSYFGTEPGGGVAGFRITLIHDGNFTCTFFDNSSSDGTASRRVRTGTGAPLVLPACTNGKRYAVELLYYPGISRWVVVRVHGLGRAAPVTLANSDATITLGDGEHRLCATATVNRAITLGTTGAWEGAIIRVVRRDTAAFTWTFTDGGASGDTTVFPASSASWGEWQFTSGSWSLVGWG